MKSYFILSICVLFACWTPGRAQNSGSGYQVVVDPENSFQYGIRDAQAGDLLNVGLAGWGPKWTWVPQPQSNEKGTAQHLDVRAPFTLNAATGQIINVRLEGSPVSNSEVAYRYTLSADKDVATTMVEAEINAVAAQNPRSLTLTADGREITRDFPIAVQDDVADVTKALYHFDGGDVTVTFDPPSLASFQAMGIRLHLATGVFPAGTSTKLLTFSFPKPVDFLASDEAMAKFIQVIAGPDWFPWSANNHTGPSVFAMDDWLEKPAGKHGGVRMKDNQFCFEDGTPVKFWGVDNQYADNYPDHAAAEDTATRFARYGINAVRLHKFTAPLGWEGFGDPNDATKFDSSGFERFDYFTSRLASHGIYYAFSHSFNFQVRPGNKSQLLAYDEIQNAYQGHTMGLINFADDVQDLLIQTVKTLLTHRNPYTGRTYAEDPAVCYVELQNEDDIFWYDTKDAFEKCPTYARKLNDEFNEWLAAKYGSQTSLASAWTGALKPGENLDAKNIALDIDPYDLSEDVLPRQSTGSQRRALDDAQFLHEKQDKFYSRFVQAIRDTGFKGPICGSPWQAPAMVPEYYNLLSDEEVGFIDRHNYFGEDDVFASMLTSPGSGLLSTGLQQVAHRPFGVSEWNINFPLLYQADGPVLMAAYGLGLQGWNSSFEFSSSTHHDNDSWWDPNAGGLPFARWHVDSPVQIGQYPALARMLYRGDVHQGDVISSRNTSEGEIAQDKFSFEDETSQQGDIKTFAGSCPVTALAAGRCVVDFTPTPQPSFEPDMTKYQNGTVITSTTGQLKWDSSDKGYFTIDTAGTKAVVGFAAEKPQKLGSITITSHTPYASIILTALDPQATLDHTKSALLTVVARAVNTNFSINLLNNHMLNPGVGPLLVEPVRADVAIAGRLVRVVNVLDQNGVRTAQTLPVQDGRFQVNSGNDHTLYYEVVYQ